MADIKNERRSALDDFAASAVRNESLPVVQMTPAALPQVTGAQAVAVYRDEARVLQRIRAAAAAAGENWYYRFPVKNRAKGTTDWIEGPSIKLANDVARIYGNCEVDCRAQDLGEYWLFHARFIDLESGYALTRPFQQRKSAGKIGGSDDERRLDIAFQIGSSKAIRNAICNALQTYTDFALDEAKGALVDKIGRDLENYRRTTAERIAKIVTIERVEAVVGRPVKEWLAPDVARVIAMGKAIADGMASVDDSFPAVRPVEAKADAALREFVAPSGTGKDPAGGGGGAPQATDEAPLSESKAGAAVTGSDIEDAEVEELADERQMLADEELSVEQRRQELKAHAISVVIKAASSTAIPVDQRLLNINEIPGAFEELDAQFVEALVRTARSVIKDGLKPAKAKSYLESLPA